MLLYLDTLYIFLIALIVLFLLIIGAYYLVQIDKRNKILNADFIQGTWERRGKRPTGEPWHFRYQINQSHIAMSGEPHFRAIANYRIVKEVENLLRLDLSNLKSDTEFQRHSIQISVDKKADRLNIDGRDYQRIKS